MDRKSSSLIVGVVVGLILVGIAYSILATGVVSVLEFRTTGSLPDWFWPVCGIVVLITVLGLASIYAIGRGNGDRDGDG